MSSSATERTAARDRRSGAAGEAVPDAQVGRAADDWAAATIEIESWRDYSPVTRAVPGMALGRLRIEGDRRDLARRLDADGVRAVRIAEPIELCAGARARSARALVLIRELTARGVAVDWTASCDDGCAAARRWAHLFPPVAVRGAPASVATDWRRTFFPCKCVCRRGPGFTEVRDRRFGTLEMFTIDDPEQLTAIEAMAEGTPVAAVPAHVRRDLSEAGLVAAQAGHLWWLPVRVHRWPFPPLIV
ncbi:DUF5825 family protein [Actinoalloteichus fjordicus]|uniref:Uncharacterized protein n=1 Tax=Actinoalloteichus fjordicus TaxID=1612552 RepID=A0AAC9PTE2_9PSEU|nr:DUF5825 family protein [Actinoalloteichus fjordicus]APU15952.1 hypothetical protein UA74_19635 [Actinoalloteichus fjordicus]